MSFKFSFSGFSSVTCFKIRPDSSSALIRREQGDGESGEGVGLARAEGESGLDGEQAGDEFAHEQQGEPGVDEVQAEVAPGRREAVHGPPYSVTITSSRPLPQVSRRTLRWAGTQ